MNELLNPNVEVEENLLFGTTFSEHYTIEDRIYCYERRIKLLKEYDIAFPDTQSALARCHERLKLLNEMKEKRDEKIRKSVLKRNEKKRLPIGESHPSRISEKDCK